MNVVEPPGGGAAEEETKTGARGFLGDVGKAAIPLLVSAGAFFTFVAVVGGAIVWFRFYAMGIPPEQAADALPRTELVVIGTVPLVLFGLLGALAVTAAYLLDRGGRATRRTFYLLVGLFVAECVVVVFLARYDARADQEWGALALIGGAAAVAVCFAHLCAADDEPAPAIEGESLEERPQRFRHTIFGRLLLLAIVVGLVLCVRQLLPYWAPIAMGAAAVVALALYQVAWATNARFAWFGVAIFLSVPVFGAAVFAAHLWYEPVAQPVAAIRSVNGSLSAFEGIYVTETDDRLVLASVATLGCGKENEGLRRGSGRIYRIPSAELIAMELGPLQPLVSAGERARVMRFRLIRKALAQEAPSDDKENAKSQRQPPPATKKGVLLATRALRREPEISEPPPETKPGGSIEITGKGFGKRRGAVVVGSSRAFVRNEDRNWTDKRIKARLPEGARSGFIDVICPESRILRVLRKPLAVARAVPLEGRGAYQLDSSGSRDRDGFIDDRIWTHNGKRLEKAGSVPIAVSPGRHRIVLTVVDDEKLRARDSLTLVRLPATRLFCFDCRTLSPEGEAALGSLRKLVAAASFVRVDGHTDFVGAEDYNDKLSRDRACVVARELAGSGRPLRGKFEVRAYGESQPIDLGAGPAAGARNRRVDILIDDTRTQLGRAGGRRVRCVGRRPTTT